MSIDNKKIALVLCGVVDVRAQKTAHALATEGAQVTIHAFTPQKEEFTNTPFAVEYHSKIWQGGSQIKLRLLRIFMNLTVHRIINLGRKLINFLEARRGEIISSKFITKTLVDSSPDIIHVINPDVLEGSAQAAEILGVPFIYESYEYWPEFAFDPAYYYNRSQRLYLVHSEQKYASLARAMVTVSPYLARNYQKKLNLSREPLVVFNAPSDVAQFTNAVQDSVKFLFVGVMLKNRNIQALFEAVKELEGCTLTLQGADGELGPWLRRQTKEQGLQDKIFVKEPVPYSELVTSLTNYDVGVICYQGHDEHFQGALPNKFFEYLAGGLVVAASNTKAFCEFPNFEDFGYYLDPADSVSIRKDLQAVLDDRESLDAKKQAALKAGHKYCGEAQGKKVVDLYEDVLENE